MPGVGEALFSITSSPTNKEFMEFSIKKCGCVTEWLHQCEPGQQVTIRGPYGNGFPVDTDLKGKDLVFIAGGIGLAPLRSVINYVRDKRDDYGKVTVIYGARTDGDLVDYEEIKNEWMNEKDFSVHLTIDRETPTWDGNVGFVPAFVEQIAPDPSAIGLICGPPILIKLTLVGLQKLGFSTEQIYTTLELKMKCAIGKCGRCNVGDKYVCKDGPVFKCSELNELPNEY
jgi:NAD(P)H-flavin reductase